MRRHNFVANTAAAGSDLICVWQEEKTFQPMRYATNADDEAVIQKHFADRDASEEEYFAGHGTVLAPVRRLKPGTINDPAELDAMRRAEPDAVLVFGTGLLKQPLIDSFPGRIMNIHLGLSPYYRGAGTNFWPLVNGEPEYCGATVHFLDVGVDTGPMIAHVRPDIRTGDGPHDIGNKIIAAAAPVQVAAAVAHTQQPLAGVVQHGEGREYKRAHFSADAVRTLYANVAAGMVDQYLANKAARDAKLSLVTLQQRLESRTA